MTFEDQLLSKRDSSHVNTALESGFQRISRSPAYDFRYNYNYIFFFLLLLLLLLLSLSLLSSLSLLLFIIIIIIIIILLFCFSAQGSVMFTIIGLPLPLIIFWGEIVE